MAIINERELCGVEILYEDNHVICAVKPRGMLSQADATGGQDILSVLKRYIAGKYNKPGGAYLGLVHRLDRPVGGVMAFARTSKAAGRLSGQIRERSFKRVYYAVLRGAPECAEGAIHAAGVIRAAGPIRAAGRLEHIITKDRLTNKVRVADINSTNGTYANGSEKKGASDRSADVNGALDNSAIISGAEDSSAAISGAVGNNAIDNVGDYASLDYVVLATVSLPDSGGSGESAGRVVSLARVTLNTGRPHQIRAQFAFTGNPVVGDRKYGQQVMTGAQARGQQAKASAQARGLQAIGMQAQRMQAQAALMRIPDWPSLWAAEIAFDHPVTRMPVTVTARPPDEYPWNLFSEGIYTNGIHIIKN